MDDSSEISSLPTRHSNPRFFSALLGEASTSRHGDSGTGSCEMCLGRGSVTTKLGVMGKALTLRHGDSGIYSCEMYLGRGSVTTKLGVMGTCCFSLSKTCAIVILDFDWGTSRKRQCHGHKAERSIQGLTY